MLAVGSLTTSDKGLTGRAELTVFKLAKEHATQEKVPGRRSITVPSHSPAPAWLDLGGIEDEGEQEEGSDRSEEPGYCGSRWGKVYEESSQIRQTGRISGGLPYRARRTVLVLSLSRGESSNQGRKMTPQNELTFVTAATRQDLCWLLQDGPFLDWNGEAEG